MSSINEKLDYLNETKQLIRSSLVQRGQTVDDSTPFRDYASKILNIDTQSDFIDNRTVINDFTYQTDGYYKDMPNPDDYKVNTTVLCIGNLYSAESVLEQTAFVIYQIMSVSDGNAHCKVVDILDEYNVGDIKLFETEEEMNSDSSAKEGDLAVVYGETIQNMTAESETQYITFPETVTLPSSVTSDYYCTIGAVDESVMFNGHVQLNQNSFMFDGFSENGMIMVHYTSSDGVTYTRDEFMGDSGDLTNPVDLGTTVHCEMSEEWNDLMGYFMQIDGKRFDGLYEFKGQLEKDLIKLIPLENVTFDLDASSGFSNFQIDYNSNHIFSLTKVVNILNKINDEYDNDGNGYALCIDSDGDLCALEGRISDSVMFIHSAYDWYNPIYDFNKNFLGIAWSMAGSFDTLTTPYIRKYSLNLNDSTFSIKGNTLPKLTGGVSSAKPNTKYWPVDIVTVPMYITISTTSSNDFSISYYASSGSTYDRVSYSFNYNTEVYQERYRIAPSQLTLESASQLLPDIIAYGKNGNVTGDGSIYDNTLTPTEYNESNSTLDEILEGYKPASVTQMNLFVQSTEPQTKNGIWVKTDTQYENKIAVQNALSETGEYTKLKNIPYGFANGSAVAIGTDIYLLGGNGSNRNNYKYNTLTDTYTQLANTPYAFDYGSAVAIGTDIYLLGGNIGSQNNYKYDTLTDTYTQLKIIPYSFTYGDAVPIGTDIYLLGGSSQNNNYKYDTLTDKYTKLKNIPYGFVNGSAVAIGTDIYLLGGNISSIYNYKYDTLTDKYTKLADIPYNFYLSSAVAIGTDIYLLGGSSSLKNNYKYNTLTDTYTKLADIPYNFYNGSAVAVGTDIYTLGGENNGTYNYKFILSLQNDIPNNSLVLEQAGSIYKTILFDSDFTNGIEYKFTNVWLKNADGTIDITTPVYYGNGTQWIQFNGEVDN